VETEAPQLGRGELGVRRRAGFPVVPELPQLLERQMRERPLGEERFEPELAVPACERLTNRVPIPTPAQAQWHVERKQRDGRDQRDRDAQENREPVDGGGRRGPARTGARTGCD